MMLSQHHGIMSTLICAQAFPQNVSSYINSCTLTSLMPILFSPRIGHGEAFQIEQHPLWAITLALPQHPEVPCATLM
jgi:hypothetical protein